MAASSRFSVSDAMNLCTKYIVEKLEFPVTMDHITQKDLFTDTELKELTDRSLLTTDKIRALITTIKGRGEKAFDTFLDVLEETKQDDLLALMKEAIASLKTSTHATMTEHPSVQESEPHPYTEDQSQVEGEYNQYSINATSSDPSTVEEEYNNNGLR